MKKSIYIAGKRIKLKPGKFYTFRFVEKIDGNRLVSKKKLKLLQCYPFHALFKSASGIRTCFDYWTIGKLFRGEEVIF